MVAREKPFRRPGAVSRSENVWGIVESSNGENVAAQQKHSGAIEVEDPRVPGSLGLELM